MNVIKRDGRIVEFNKQKIVNAISLAMKRCEKHNEELCIKIANEIENLNKDFTVEEIQDIVEKKLMASSYKDVAKEYIIYREKRTFERNKKSKLMKTIKEKLEAKNVQNQNANVDEHSFGGRVGEASDAVMRDYALNNCMSEMSKSNHLNNEIYEHDLNSYAIGSHNCLSIPFDHLLKDGFNTRQTDVRPAQSINTAFQLLAVIFQLQSLQQFGGVSSTHLDWTMVPYVRKSFFKHYIDGLHYIESAKANTEIKLALNKEEAQNVSIEDKKVYNHPMAYNYAFDMTKKEIYQSVEGMFHNLNTLQSRSGNQLPFTSINFGTCTKIEGRLVIRAILETSIKGIGKLHKTSIFPCNIFQVGEGINKHKGDPNYDLFRLALKSTAQRLYPNYANIDWSGNEGYDKNDPRTYFSTMGCRTANGWDINGFGQLKDGRGNICPVTIIMPTLAMEAKEFILNNKENNSENIDEQIINKFFEILNQKIYEAKDMLIERFEWICNQSPDSAKFMYENGLMAGYVPEEGIRSALKHGTLAIGQIGLAETLQILINCNHTEKKGMNLAKKIEELFKKRCEEFKEQYKLNFGVYYTPAENLCYTAMKKFKDKYGVIKNVSDKDFFTNSIHVPVWEEMSPIKKIDIESQLTGYSSAGCITYVELESTVKNNIDALETLVVYAMDKDIPYFAINVPNDTCLTCGYTDELNDECPQCHGRFIQRLRRVTGYLTGDYLTAFNKGKQQEVNMRVKHK